jgi:hypothetical protein
MVNRGTIHSLRRVKKGGILESMQGHIACQLKPAFFRLDQLKFPAVTTETAAFPKGGGVIIFIFLSRENPVKYTDPDGRDTYNVKLIGAGVKTVIGGGINWGIAWENNEKK